MAVTPPVIPTFSGKTTKKVKTYLWTTDSKGNIVKTESSIAKKAFALLGEKEQVALAQQLLNTNIVPTSTSLKSLWGQIVDGAVAEYKKGNQSTPWDVLQVLAKNTPITTGITNTQITQYDPTTANALLNNTALGIQFDIGQLSEADRADYISKLTEAAGESGKVIQKTLTAGGSQTVVTPNLFDAKAFTENWLWSKVNLGDTARLPAKAITALSTVKTVLNGMGIDYLSSKEINQLGVELAAGRTSANSIREQFLPQAKMNYPQLADRLDKVPGSTVQDLVTPYINAIAKWWEVDPQTINITDPVLDRALRPDGTAGKLPMASLADFVTTLKTSPEADKTTWANESARSAATGLARAMGFGV